MRPSYRTLQALPALPSLAAMDVLPSNPASPPGNPETADAAIPPQAPTTILRKDYRPPEWLVPQVALDFALDLTAARVRATLTVERNPAGSGSVTLRLDGDGVTADEVLVDGR